MRLSLEAAKRKRAVLTLLVLAVFVAPSFHPARAQQQARDISKLPTRPARDWVRDGVIYEIYPRAFSAEARALSYLPRSN